VRCAASRPRRAAPTAALLALLGSGCDAVSVVGFVEGAAPATDPSAQCAAGSLLLGCNGDNACGVHPLTSDGRVGSMVLAVDDEMRVFHIVDGAPGLDDIVALAPGEAPQVVASGISQVMDLEVDETQLYWLPHNGDVYRAPKDGSGSPQVIDLPLGNGRKLALAGARGYATVLRENLADVQGDVVVFDKNGSSQEVALPQPRPWAVAATGSAVLWSNDGFEAAAGEIVVGGPDLLGAAVVASGLVAPHAITVAGAHVVWVTEGEAASLLRAPVAGGAPEVLAEGLNEPKALGFFEGMIYVGTADGLLRFSADDGARQDLSSDGVLALEVRCSGVYAHHWHDGGIVRYGRSP
jgi:hypothetical protein